jgi:hydroxymethylglutaryl-CoA reductase (NADPH)
VKIPSLVLKQLYTHGSLENSADGVVFTLKNRLSDAVLTGLDEIKIDGNAIPADKLVITLDDRTYSPSDIKVEDPISFPLAKIMTVLWKEARLETGKHTVGVAFVTTPFGKLAFSVKDSIRETREERVKVPYDRENDYSEKIIAERQGFARAQTGVSLNHVTKFSFDPTVTQGNIESFVGVAQVPIGLAGPIKVNGEHAKGEYLVPMATTEGTLVASYNRGIKVINLSGGVTCTVSDDRMQRAPVFVFSSAREARGFRDWVLEHISEIGQAAEATSSVAKLLDIDTFLASRFAYLRFNFATGDAAGQNMVGRATFAACSWMLDKLDNVERFYLESNLSGRQSRCSCATHAGGAGEPSVPFSDFERWFVPLRGEQQRCALAQRDYRDVHCHRAGCCKRRRIVIGHSVHRTHPGERSVHVPHDSIADRRDLWRWHGAADPERVSGTDGLCRPGEGQEAR